MLSQLPFLLLDLLDQGERQVLLSPALPISYELFPSKGLSKPHSLALFNRALQARRLLLILRIERAILL